MDAGTAAMTDGGESLDGGDDAGTAASRELPVQLTAVLADGGLEELSITGAHAEVPPTRALELFTPVRLREPRVRLFDWADKVVPSDDRPGESDAGLDYRLNLLEALRPGRTYELVIDAQAGGPLLDLAGGARDDLHVTLKVRGELAAEPGKRPPRKRR